MFNGPKHFGAVVAFFGGGALICVPILGWWPFLAVGIILYNALLYFNRLEARDRGDQRKKREQEEKDK
jgi:hypothetical protein